MIGLSLIKNSWIPCSERKNSPGRVNRDRGRSHQSDLIVHEGRSGSYIIYALTKGS